MDIVKVIGVAFVSIIVISMIKSQKPEFATYASLIGGAIILFMIIGELAPIIKMLQGLSDKLGVSSKFLGILLKITGIAYLTEFGSNVCKDAGEVAISSKVELAGKVLIISLSIPILLTLIETLLELVWGGRLNKNVFFFFTMFILFCFITSNTFATDETNVSGFISEVKEYSNDVFPELSDENFLNSVLKRRYDS